MPLFGTEDDIADRKDEEIEMLKRNFEETLYDKDIEISSLRKSVKDMTMRRTNTNLREDSESFGLRSELEKSKKLLRESEIGERDLFSALKECETLLREREDELQAMKEDLRHKLEEKNDEVSKESHKNELLEQEVKEKENTIEELRLSLWEAESYCQRESTRLKKVNEETVFNRERELNALQREAEAAKRRLEDDIDRLRKSFNEALALKEAELERLRKTAANFEDAAKIDESTINQLRGTLEQKEYVLYEVQRRTQLDMDAKNDQLQQRKTELQKKVGSLEREVENIQAHAHTGLNEKDNQLGELKKTYEDTHRDLSNQIVQKDSDIENYRKEIKQMEEERKCLEDKLKQAETILLSEQECTRKLREEIGIITSKTESLRKAKEESQQNLNDEILVLQRNMHEEVNARKKEAIKAERLSNSSKDKDCQLAKLQNKCDNIQEENKNVNESFRSLTSKLEAKDKSLTKTTKSVDVLESERTTLQKEIHELKQELLEKGRENGRYEEALGNLERFNDEVQEVEKYLKEENLKLKDKSSGLESLLHDKDNEIKSLREKMKSSESLLYSEGEKWQVLDLSYQETVRKMKTRYDKLEKEIYFLRKACQEKEEVSVSLNSMLEEAKTNEGNFEVRIENLLQALENEKESRATTDREMQKLSGQYSSLVKKLKRFEVFHEQQIGQETEHLLEIFEKKEMEISSENNAYKLTCQKLQEDLDALRKSSKASLQQVESEKEELRKSTMQSIKSKENEVQRLVDCSKEFLNKKEGIISGFKKFVQESAVKNQNALLTKDETIKTMRQSTETFSAEKESMIEAIKTLEQAVQLKEGEMETQISDNRFRFSVLVKKCSEMENSAKKSEEKSLRVEAMARNSLERKEQALKDLQHNSKQEQTIKKELENELNKIKERLRREELLVKEAGKIIKNITEEKNQEIMKVRVKTEECEQMEETLKERQSIIQSLEQTKSVITKENDRLEKDNMKHSEDVQIRDQKIDGLVRKVNHLKENRVELKKKLAKAQKLEVKIRERLELKNQQNKELRQTVHEMNILIVKNNEEHQMSLDKKNTLERHRRELEKRLHELTDIIVEKDVLVASLRHTMENKGSLIDNLGNKIALLNGELQSKDQENEAKESRVEELEEMQQAQVSKTQEIERITNDELDSLTKQLEVSRMYLNRGEQIINAITKERDGLLHELGKTVETHKDVVRTMESYNNCLQKDKAALEEKLTILEKELSASKNQNADLRSSLNAAEISQKFLSERIGELNVTRQVLENEKEANSSLRNQLKQLEILIGKEKDETRRKTKKSEAVFSSLRDESNTRDNVLRGKENDLRNAETTNRQIKQENQELTDLVHSTNQVNKDLERALLSYKHEAEGLETTLAKLRTDNEFLKNFAEDTEKVKLKLQAHEESLEAKAKELADFREKLSLEKGRSSTLQNEVKEKELSNREIKSLLETRLSTLEKEVNELRIMLDERNRELSLSKMEKNNFEVQQREAEMKIMELNNSLKNEASFHQSIAQRNQELEFEIRKINFEKKVEPAPASIPIQTLREIHHPDLRAERIIQQKVDNIALDKIRNLHSKTSQLEVELEQERHNRVKEHAEVARLKAEVAIYKSMH